MQQIFSHSNKTRPHVCHACSHSIHNISEQDTNYVLLSVNWSVNYHAVMTYTSTSAMSLNAN